MDPAIETTRKDLVAAMQILKHDLGIEPKTVLETAGLIEAALKVAMHFAQLRMMATMSLKGGSDK